MTNKRGVYAAKFGAYFLAIVLLYVLQTTPGFLTVFGVKPNFVVPAAICIAMYEGEFIGGLYGALAGVLCDLGDFTLFGFNAILVMIACVAVGLLTIYMLRQTVINFVLLLFVTMLVRGLLDYLLNYVMWGYEDVWMVLAYRAVPLVLYTTAVSPLAYYLFRWIYGQFAKRLEL